MRASAQHSASLKSDRPASFKRLLGRARFGLRRCNLPCEAITKVTKAALTDPPIRIIRCVPTLKGIGDGGGFRELRPAELAVIVIPVGARRVILTPMERGALQVLLLIPKSPVIRCHGWVGDGLTDRA